MPRSRFVLLVDAWYIGALLGVALWWGAMTRGLISADVLPPQIVDVLPVEIFPGCFVLMIAFSIFLADKAASFRRNPIRFLLLFHAYALGGLVIIYPYRYRKEYSRRGYAREKEESVQNATDAER